jgi:caffeoyl-CoA O-methyltransferase
MDDLTITDELWEYMRRVTLREPALLRRLREETAPYPNSSFQISAEQGQFMALLMHLIGARRTIEIGVYTGYSALSVALALPADGRIIACDINAEWTSVGRRYWSPGDWETSSILCSSMPIRPTMRITMSGLWRCCGRAD